MTHHLSPILAAAAALVAGALAIVLALWAQQRRHRWLHHPAPRKRRKGGAPRWTP